MLKGKHITLAMTGGIACYKICEVVRGLKRLGADVRVAMTENATKFVTPLTLEALSGHPVAVTEWEASPGGSMPHIDLTTGADLLLVAPATANTLAKAAHGIADDLVSTLVAARRCPIIFVPAMNVNMWRNPANQRNVRTLLEDGAHFIGPAAGLQACGDSGEGRMSEPSEILDRLSGIFTPQLLAGCRVLVTAGPTYEAIDAVRGITNRSSGRQGFALARAARDAGAEVTLIAGPCALPAPAGVRRIDVVSAREMHTAVEAELERAPVDFFAAVAAVADWAPEAVHEGKWKKAEGGAPFSKLVWSENPDILKAVGTRSVGRPAVVTGFAAECCELEAAARSKCLSKGADFVVANDVREAAGAVGNTLLITTLESVERFGPASKDDCARRIIERAAECLAARKDR